MYSKFFKRSETACKCGCGGGTKPGDMDDRILLVATAVRIQFDAPVTITSAYRCHKHNASVGGAAKSRHLPRDRAGNLVPVGMADAIDISVKGVPPSKVQAFIIETFPTVSVGTASTFTHLDYRPAPRVVFPY